MTAVMDIVRHIYSTSVYVFVTADILCKTTFPFKTLYRGHLWTHFLQFWLTNVNSFSCFS